MTLIEVLVASVLLGVGVAGLLSVASLAMRNQQKVERRAAALYLAREKLAEVELAGPHVWMLGQPAEGAREQGGVAYEWNIQIDQLAVGELFAVAVDVRWSAPGGSGAVDLETWLNDYEAVASQEVEQPEQTMPGEPARPPGR
jgi:general secretion pathway protein I